MLLMTALVGEAWSGVCMTEQKWRASLSGAGASTTRLLLHNLLINELDSVQYTVHGWMMTVAHALRARTIILQTISFAKRVHPMSDVDTPYIRVLFGSTSMRENG